MLAIFWVPPSGTIRAVGYPGCDAREVRQREEAMAGMKEFANLFYAEGALDPKTAQLVAMAAMAAAGCTS